MKHGEVQLNAAQHHAYAVKAQRQFHWLSYDPARRAQILERVQRLIAARPGSYLARHWMEVYR